MAELSTYTEARGWHRVFVPCVADDVKMEYVHGIHEEEWDSILWKGLLRRWSCPPEAVVRCIIVCEPVAQLIRLGVWCAVP